MSERPAIRLYDTLAREKREFVPIDPGRITMYVCGPTVYGRAHIGNARPAVVFDTLARLIRHHYGLASLTYARNVTDVDDKIIASAEEEGVDPAVITARFEQYYLDDMRALGVRDPDLAPHATAEIPAMVAMIAALIAKGNAYEAQGHVLFSVQSDPDYGVLSRRDREAMLAGARVEVAPYKRDGADFVLWKPSEPGVIGWEFPWGRGRPGWHIECSAMIAAHLGETIDIHGGGLDLIFPHHENEIAQSRCAHGGKPLANYWLHNGFLDMGAEKMSKSLGNVVTVDALLAQGHRGEVLRLALLSAHYRKPLAWTDDLIERTRLTLQKFYGTFTAVFESIEEEALLTLTERLPPVSVEMVQAVADDLNSAEAIAWLHKSDSEINALLLKGKAGAAKARAVQMFVDGQLLGLSIRSTSSDAFQEIYEILDEQEINEKIAARNEAKAKRDFAAADRIRDELKADGILLEDGHDGTSWRRA